MESWKNSMLTGIFFLILAIALAIYNGKITAGTIAMLILTIIGMANAMRLKPKN
jgi:ABC-type bacteriocin/lantibiotic exporter with double-glycine peptidase domain